ncbi:sensor histidine kinase [Streptomyces clavuligerus]|nr:histidine kinase [Streptomyces clavuligerus]ANW20224.1 histidine kinase [Streptomyces clavuligerus]AXU14848.1 histidine kinase [Streptomyces clavuligerus]MBY6304885.1 histidine kinase [Streptomyces clavuligerus]QCS07620.1 histidine kinase [Streptomyces clavuligerus]QPJ93035.1 histidine kinase [Streptomyces clavuligerus]
MQLTTASYGRRRLVAVSRRYAQRWTTSPRAVDVITAIGCLALMVLDVPGLADGDNRLTSLTATLVLTAGAASLLVRRRAPWLPYGVALLLLAWLHELTLAQFALYSLGRFRGRRAGVLSTAGYVLVAFVLFHLPGWPEHHAGSLGDFLSLIVPVGVLASGVGVAAYRHDLVRELEARRAETAALQAVRDERISVARDVHDLVGRELTVLAVRAEVLSVRARGTPQEKNFEELADTARRAHLMLNDTIVHRADERTATPGLEGLPALAEESGRLGSPVTLRIGADASRLSPLRQTAVYRVVQECLINAAKHAPGEPVTVAIGLEGSRLRIVARNALPQSAPSTEPVSSGTGTFSMRERVRSMGGTLTARADADSGSYEVLALLPAGWLRPEPGRWWMGEGSAARTP